MSFVRIPFSSVERCYFSIVSAFYLMSYSSVTYKNSTEFKYFDQIIPHPTVSIQFSPVICFVIILIVLPRRMLRLHVAIRVRKFEIPIRYALRSNRKDKKRLRLAARLICQKSGQPFLKLEYECQSWPLHLSQSTA